MRRRIGNALESMPNRVDRIMDRLAVPLFVLVLLTFAVQAIRGLL